MRVFDFKKALQLTITGMVMLSLLIIAACGEDEPEVNPVTVEFSNAAQTITEDGGAKNITLTLSSAAKKDGTITLNATPANANTFATFPTEINVTKGSTSAQFTLTPINNAVIDASAKVITFTLDDPSSGFELGEQTTLAVTITDDEGPTTANFTVASGSVAENASAGITVAIALSPAADVAGEIKVTITPTDAAVTTTPTATAGVITVPVAVGQTSVSFTVVPVNNTVDGDNFEVDFELTGVTGGVNLGTNVDYTLTVTDDDDIVPTSIANVRAMHTGSDVNISTDIYIKGVVTSSNANYTNRNLFIQDASGAIVVRFTAAHAYVPGDELLINLNGALLTKDAGSGNTGPLQLGGTAGIDAAVKAVKTGTASVPASQTVTVAQVNGGTFEGKLVKLENVLFPDADGILKLNGSRTLSNGTETTIVRSESYAPWQNDAIPLGSGAIEGIASVFNGVVQVIPMEAADIFASNPVGTIGTTGTLVDFGSVNNGGSSSEQFYTVQGTTLTSDVVITASAGYEVSLTSGSGFGSSVTILAANANSATTVFVKFAPTTGVNQAVAGTLTHKSQGAASVVTNVTGTESGNGASSVLLTENFDLGTSSGNLLDIAGSGWLITGTSTTNPVQYVTGASLSMSGYAPSGVGGSATLTTTGQDVRKPFTASPLTSGIVYMSSLVKITSAQSTGDYFLHLSDGGTSIFYDRIYAKDEAGVLRFGFFPSSGTPVYSTNNYSYNTTYLLVAKYDFSTMTASLYILDAASATEPGAATLSGTAASNPANLSHIALRQGTAANAPVVTVDGIRVATVWADLFN